MTKLSESEKFNDLDINRLARQVRQNDGRANRGIVYRDDRRYNDYQGEKWLDVRSKDRKTLVAAVLDGMSDVQYHYKGKLYKDIKDEDDLTASYEANKAVVDPILNFLGKYMHGHTTVYRGFNFDRNDYLEMKSKYGIKFEHQLLKILNNRGKKFNSFSVSPFVSRDFAEDGYGDVALIIAADVEPNDIAFAFTAYLLGRHGSVGEYELNINNLKDLHNLRIITDIDKECERFAKYNDTEEELQKRLDSGEPLDSVFNNIKKVKLFNGEIYICGTVSGDVAVQDNKIVVPRSKDIRVVYDGIYVVTPLNKDCHILYNVNTGKKSKDFDSIVYGNVNEDNKLIIASDGSNKYNLINIETCRPIFNGYAKQISRLPGATWYGYKNIWHGAEFYLVKLRDDMFTVVNDDGKCIFKRPPYKFLKIECNPDELTMDCESEQGEKPRRFVIKNNMAVERL